MHYYSAQHNKLPSEILGTHNQMLSNHRSPQGFLLGWAADEAVAAAVYLFVRHANNPHDLLLKESILLVIVTVLHH